MAQAKYSRIDNNKRSASSYFSTVTIVVFVALCLFGIWMMTSSSVVPVQNVDVSQDNKNEVQDQSGVIEQSEGKEQATDPSNKSSQQFEDNQGDLSDDAAKGDSSVAPDKTSDGPEKGEDKLDEKSEEKPSEEPKTENQDSNFGEKKSDSEESVKKSDSDESEKKSDSDESENKSGSDENDKKQESDGIESKPESNDSKQLDSDSNDKKTDDAGETSDKTEEKGEQSGSKDSDENSDEKKTDDSANNQVSNDVLPSVAQSDLLNESTAQNGSFSTQASKSNNEKKSQESSKQSTGYDWKLCNVTAGPDFIPCLDNVKAISSLPSTKHYEHRERQCPQEPPTCLVALPEGYKRPIEWPKSRDKVDINTNARQLPYLFKILFFQ